MTSRLLLSAALTGLMLALGVAGGAHAAPSCSTTAGAATCSFAATAAEDSFTVPAGVTVLHVTAIGAPGGNGAGDSTPGRGARVAADLAVVPGSVLYVDVGGAPTAGGICLAGASCIGGFNGGGSTKFGGGGGGASDIRMIPRAQAGSLASRLLVAAGGGGGGEAWPCSALFVGGVGGDAGAAGGDAPPCNGTPSTGGGPGSQVAGGSAGSPSGQAGGLGQGGNGGGDTGGGGGGGLYGGGGGGSLGFTSDFNDLTPAGGGGGGSNLVPGGGTEALTTSAPSVVLSYQELNVAPAASDDAFTTGEDTPLSITAPGVLGNDSDVNVDPLTAAVVSAPAHGTLTLNADGSFTYAAQADYNGADSFTYQARDGSLGSPSATVAITVGAINDRPVCNRISAATVEGAAVDLAAVCTDVDNTALSYAIVKAPAHGTASVAGGRLRYQPAAGYHGTDSFTYRANDGSLDSKAMTATITVAAAPAVVLQVQTPSLSAFSRGRSPARCRVDSGRLSACTVRLLRRGRVLARGSASAGGPGTLALTVRLALTDAGRRLLDSRVGGVQTVVRAVAATTAGSRSAQARTRALLAVEHFTTSPGSWLPNQAKLSARGKRFVRSLRGRLIAVAALRCDGYAARVGPESATATRISVARGRAICAALERLGGDSATKIVGHGAARPVASNATASGRAANRRVEVTVTHHRQGL
jgi:VCBS repeat-containing protein